MSDIIKMDYPLMEEMSQIFSSGAEQLDETLREMQTIANTLEGGVLLGNGGQAFCDSINSRLCPSVARLRDKFEELSQDLYGALVDLRDGDTSAQSRFKG